MASSSPPPTTHNVAVAAAAAVQSHPQQHNNSSSSVVPKIENVLATADLGCQGLDLAVIHKKASNSEYSTTGQRFPSVTLRLREPRATVQVFASGKINITGTESEGDAKLSGKKVRVILERMGFKVKKKLQGFQVQNMTAACHTAHHIHLAGLAAACPLFATYNPERFPGLTYRMHDPKVTITVHHSGAIHLTGAKSKEEIMAAFHNILPVLQQHQLPAGSTAPGGGKDNAAGASNAGKQSPTADAGAD